MACSGPPMGEVIDLRERIRKMSLDAKAASALAPRHAEKRERAYELAVKWSRLAYPLKVPNGDLAEVLHFHRPVR